MRIKQITAAALAAMMVLGGTSVKGDAAAWEDDARVEALYDRIVNNVIYKGDTECYGKSVQLVDLEQDGDLDAFIDFENEVFQNAQAVVLDIVSQAGVEGYMKYTGFGTESLRSVLYEKETDTYVPIYEEYYAAEGRSLNRASFKNLNEQCYFDDLSFTLGEYDYVVDTGLEQPYTPGMNLGEVQCGGWAVTAEEAWVPEGKESYQVTWFDGSTQYAYFQTYAESRAELEMYQEKYKDDPDWMSYIEAELPIVLEKEKMVPTMQNILQNAKPAAVVYTCPIKNLTKETIARMMQKVESGDYENNTNNATGDVDGDGSITLTDAQLALKMALGIETATPEQTIEADCDGDGAISLADAQMILKKALGII